MSIKDLKPNRNSKFGKQGYFDISNSTKYTGDPPCIYRSNLELRFFNLFENTDDYESWESEPLIEIKYEFEGKIRTYNVDVMFINTKIGKYIAEIKPFYQVTAPKNPGRRGYENELQTYKQNVAKWTAAKKWAEDNDMKFCVLTENFFK